MKKLLPLVAVTLALAGCGPSTSSAHPGATPMTARSSPAATPSPTPGVSATATPSAPAAVTPPTAAASPVAPAPVPTVAWPSSPEQPVDPIGPPHTATGTVTSGGSCLVVTSDGIRWALIGSLADSLRVGDRVSVRGRLGAVPQGCAADRGMLVQLVTPMK